MNAHAVTCAEPPGRPAFAKPLSAQVLALPGKETHLIARLRKGDERAFNELVEKNHGTLIRMALRYVADHDVAEEVVQDTWIAVIDGIKHFEGRSSLKTWMCSLAGPELN